MPKRTYALASASVALTFYSPPVPLTRQIPHSWVSNTGTGAACTRASPCGNFAAAQTATTAGGIISILNPGDYGEITITKSLTIRGDGVDGGNGGIVPAATLEINAGPNDIVILEGLYLNSNTVYFAAGGQLHIVRCFINAGHTSGRPGVVFNPNGFAKLSVTDTVVTNAGSAGLFIDPQNGGSAQAALERVTVYGNDGPGIEIFAVSNSGVNVTIADSAFNGNNGEGIVAIASGTGAVGVMVSNTQSVNNINGIVSDGATTTVRVVDSTIIGNVTGLSTVSSGALLSYGNNKVRANATDGAFTAPLSLQ